MQAIIGIEGAGYYNFAYNVYSLLLLISSYSIPLAVSKIVSERLATKQYKNAYRIFRSALIYAAIVGGVAALICWFFAGNLLPVSQQNAIPALRVLAPTIFFSAILGVLRGYMQAYNTMLPTSVSQIAEQLMNAFVSVLAAWILTSGITDSESIAIQGAMGGTIGTGAGVIIALLFMCLVYSVNASSLKKRRMMDRTKEHESYPEIFKTIILIVTPVIFATCIYNLCTFVNQNIFAWLMALEGVGSKKVAELYGVFGNQYNPIMNIPIALASASSTAIIPTISGSYSTGDTENVRKSIGEAFQFTMFIAIPATVGLAVLAHPIMNLLFPSGDNTIAGNLLQIGAVSAIFYSLSTITQGALQGIGKTFIPVRNAAISLAVNVILLVLLLKFTNMGIYALVISTMVYSFGVSVLNGLSVRKFLDYKSDWMAVYGIPAVAAIGMGIVAFGLYHLLYILIRSNAVCLVIAILVAVIVYIGLYLMIGKIPEEQLLKLPKGRLLLKIAKKFRIYR